MITLRLCIGDEVKESNYTDPSTMLRDESLRVLFDDDHVSSCTIHIDDQQVAGVPEGLCTWPRFCDAVTSNATKLLSEVRHD